MADKKAITTEQTTELHDAADLEEWYQQEAQLTSAKWGERLDQFELPCPLCKGELQFQGVHRDRLYEFAEGEPGAVTPLNVLPISFVCNQCGYTAEFDAQMFNPAYLAQIQGATSERVAELSVREFRVLVPVTGEEKNQTLLDLASALASIRDGEVIVLRVTPDATGEAQIAEKLQGYQPGIGKAAPIHLLIQRTDDIGEAIVNVASRQRCGLLMVSWRGWTRNQKAIMGTVLDPVLNEVVCDVAVVHDHGLTDVRRILLPTAGGPNIKAAAQLAYDLARTFDAELHVVYVAAPSEGKERGREQIEKTLDGVQGDDDIIVKKRVLVGADPVQTIVEESANYDLLLIGASHRNWLGRIRRGSMVARIVRNCNPTSIVVSARRSRIGSWLGRLFT